MNVYHIFNAHSGAGLWVGLATDQHDALRQLDAHVGAHEPSRYGGGAGLEWRTLGPAETLPELRDLLCTLDGTEDSDVFAALGLPSLPSGGLDMSALPTFGGDAPDDTAEVWSWDATSLLVGDSHPYAIVRRD
jgi:hypothetical protein